jgi:alpha-beta hydrolase superfamily lysophospholipase
VLVLIAAAVAVVLVNASHPAGRAPIRAEAPPVVWTVGPSTPAVATAAPPKPAPPPPEPRPATVESMKVPGDLPAAIVRAADGAPPRTVFVPGVCSNANAYLHAFPEAAQKHGGVIAIEGDQPCQPGFRTFSWDAAKLDARIEAALAAAEVEPSGREGLTLVGYSQGAALAEQLVQRWPERYAKIVLIGAPTDPSAAHFAKTEAVVTMSCSRDVPARMRDAAKRMTAARVPAKYIEMPGCTHGNIADGDRVFDEVFDWLAKNGR